MSIDPRRSGPALWALWVVAGALGGALATLLALAGLAALVTSSDDPTAPPYDLRVLAYLGTLAAISALFQSVVLTFIAPGRKAALLWLLSTVIGATIFYRFLGDLFFNFTLSGSFTWLPPGTASAILGWAPEALPALALGLAQGLALALIMARKLALPVWIMVSLLALPASWYLVAHLYVIPPGPDARLIVASAISTGAGAAVTGLALVLILRLGRRDRVTGPGLAARSLPAPTP